MVNTPDNVVKSYFRKLIKDKTNNNKKLLGKLYENLLVMADKLDLAELKELNDLSLLLDYLEYVNSIKEKKMADGLKERLDTVYNFAQIEGKDTQVEFDIDRVSSDRDEAKEEVFFKECGAGGFVFEDYEEDVSDEISKQTSNLISTMSSVFSDIEEDTTDDPLESLLEQIESEVAEEDDGIDSFEALEMMLDEINSGEDAVKEEEVEKDEPSGYDFFNDFTDDTDEPDDVFDELDGEDWEKESVDGEEDEENGGSFLDTLLSGKDMDEDDLTEEDGEGEEEDKDFKDFCDNKLQERWGMFISHIPGWSLEDYESSSLTVLVTLINRGKIELPEDKTLIPEDLIDYFLQQNILKERPVKKVEEVEETDSTSVDENDLESLSAMNPSFSFADMPSVSDSFGENECETEDTDTGKQLFVNKTASERVDAADELRKKLSSFGFHKFTQIKDKIQHKDKVEVGTQQKAETVNADNSNESDITDTNDIVSGTDGDTFESNWDGESVFADFEDDLSDEKDDIEDELF